MTSSISLFSMQIGRSLRMKILRSCEN